MTDKEKDIDQISGVETTGHEWDGIKELDNPLPRWWLWTFYLCILFSVGYVFWYPAIPLISTSTQGLSGKSIRGDLAEEMQVVAKQSAKTDAKLVNLSLEEIRKDDDLYRFALAGGSSQYKLHCTQCHGSGAQGALGIPNLSDDDWLWGGDPETIYQTIYHGIRDERDDESRFSQMPSFGDGYLESEAISNIAAWVRVLADLKTETSPEALETGKQHYSDNCASCHGDNGNGGREFGAPNLADAIWFYGNKKYEIADQMRNPKHGVMPAWGEKLGEANVKKLTIYIHSLGGGEKAQND